MEESQKDTSQEGVQEASIEKKFDEADVTENTLVAMLSYSGILFLVPLLLKKESPFAQFHARQGLVLTIAWIVGSFVFWIPLLGLLVMVALSVVNIMALWRTYNGQAWEIPGTVEVLKNLNI